MKSYLEVVITWPDKTSHMEKFVVEINYFHGEAPYIGDRVLKIQDLFEDYLLDVFVDVEPEEDHSYDFRFVVEGIDDVFVEDGPTYQKLLIACISEAFNRTGN